MAIVWLGSLPAPAQAQFLCTAGTRDGLQCRSDNDCPAGGCIIPLGVCFGGQSDGFPCICPSAECSAEPVCSIDPALGTCNGGVFRELCCRVDDNCFDGSPCVATQRVCIGGALKGFPCLVDDHCEGSSCRSTGGYCAGGDFDKFSCSDDDRCESVHGTCMFPAGTPIPSSPDVCVGDCNGDRKVTVDEIVLGVNLVVGTAALSSCGVFDADGKAEVTIDDLVHGIRLLLAGCR